MRETAGSMRSPPFFHPAGIRFRNSSKYLTGQAVGPDVKAFLLQKRQIVHGMQNHSRSIEKNFFIFLTSGVDMRLFYSKLYGSHNSQEVISCFATSAEKKLRTASSSALPAEMQCRINNPPPMRSRRLSLFSSRQLLRNQGRRTSFWHSSSAASAFTTFTRDARGAELRSC